MSIPARARLERPATATLLACGWVATVGALSLWLWRTPDGVLRDELRRLQFWALGAQFVLLVLLSSFNLPRAIRALRLRRQDVAYPIAASALAFALSGWVAPATNRIYYDEQIYQGIGQNLTDLGLAQMCDDGTVEYGSLQCWRGEYNKEPYGYPYLLSVAYRLFGVHEGVAFRLNSVSTVALTWLVFLITTTLTENARAGGLAALVAALMPEHLRWAHTAASEPTGAAMSALAVLAAVVFARERSTPQLLWATAAASFALQFRLECVLIVPLVVVILALYAPAELVSPRLWAAGLMGLVLSAVYVAHLVAVRHEGWGSSGVRFSTVFLPGNLQSNLWFYLMDARFPALYSALAWLAIAVWHERRTIAVLLAYFLLFWGVFLFFYAGSYNYGADDRFSLMTFPPIAIAAGMGASTLGDWIRRRWAPQPRVRLEAVIALALIFHGLWYLPFVRAVGEEAWGARADVAFARSVVAGLPKNSIVLTHNPSMFHVWGQNAAQASLATTDRAFVTMLPVRYAGGVFFHWNFWCEVADRVQQEFCTAILASYPHTLVHEHRERDYRYAFYRLDVPAARPSDEPR